MQSASKCNLVVVPPQAVPRKKILPRISQNQLRYIVVLRQFEIQRENLLQCEAEVKALLEAGAEVEADDGVTHYKVRLETLNSGLVDWERISNQILQLKSQLLELKSEGFTRLIIER